MAEREDKVPPSLDADETLARTAVITGSVAVLCCVLVGVSDMLLLGQPVGGTLASELAIHELCAGKELWHVLSGTTGALLIPLAGLGCWMLTAGLRPFSAAYRAITGWALGALFVVGPSVHALFGGAGIAIVSTRGPDGEVPHSVITAAEAIHGQLIGPAFLLALGGLLLGSVLFSGAVATGRTLYPRSMALLCPLVLVLGASFGTRLVPGPVGGYLFVAAIHLATPIFFGVPLAWWMRRARAFRQGPA